ncbi:MAG: fructose-1,6-bisphosphatase, partial [Lachnospiraceae bacterium]|nr:fructose-1,6-bisphosphatase [Lachnospiraceae bacterium]
MEYKGNWNKYLELLSKNYRNVEEVTEEIINLESILNLPKGTEVFLSDIHGEYEPFLHILNNGAGIIRSKIERLFKATSSEKERSMLATLIYYPEEKLALIKKGLNSLEELDKFYSVVLSKLVEVAKEITSKYTRSKVRKALPSGFDYIIDELLHLQGDQKNKDRYYSQIIRTIIDLDRADEFIVALSNLIKRMAIDHLHIVGDIYDRGLSAPVVMDALMKFHSLDIQWGNHDVLWMGAACGNLSCIANVVRISSRYDNLATLEDNYGISIRPLTTFALKTYAGSVNDNFMPKEFQYNKYSGTDKNSIAKVQKAIAIIQFKLEGALLKRHPEYSMDSQLLLDKIDYKKGTVELGGKTYELNDKNFPKINPNDPYKLTEEENVVIQRLYESFIHSEKLAMHISFLYSKGSIYKIFNSNLLYHGCIPMEKDGTF